jgi:ribosomal protein L24
MMIGPDKGKQGKVVKVIRSKNRLVVEGINVVRFSHVSYLHL